MTGVTQTPNIKLSLIPADFKNWADLANGNSKLLDAVVSAYFTVQNLQGLWQNSTMYALGDTVVDAASSVVYKCQVAHTSPAVPITFPESRAAHASYWTVYSSPARSRGTWMPNTTYALNDFVISGTQYAICIEAHTSSSVFATDVALSRWSILIDLSAAGSTIMPIPSAADANKFVVINGLGNGYTIIASEQTLALLGATSLGESLFKAASSADALAAIGAQPTGAYQPLDATLTGLSGVPVGLLGNELLGLNFISQLQSLAGSAGVAGYYVGTSAGELIALDGSAKLPVVDGSQLTNLPVQAVALSYAHAVAAGNVNLSQVVWADLTANLTLAAGTWQLRGIMTARDTAAGAAHMLARFYDGATEYGRGVNVSPTASNDACQVVVDEIVVLAGATTMHFQGLNPTSATGVAQANYSGGGRDTIINAVRIA